MTCPICSSSNVLLIEIKYPLFRQLDFATIKESGVIGRCGSCQSVFQSVDAHDEIHIKQQFENEAYAQSKQTSQTVTVSEFNEPVSRPILQAELICRALKRERPSILDIGCFDGALLVELNRRVAAADLHGFDVSDHLRGLFPSADHYRFWSPDLDSVEGQYDLICMSHSMAYVRDIPHLMRQIKRLMKADGVMFLQMPDISTNSCYILMGDQYYYYTPNILRNALQCFGFGFSLLANRWFPREIVGVARPAPQYEASYITDLEIYRSIEDLDDRARKLKGMCNASPLSVLGTTGNAAFVDTILGDTVSRFFDENPERVGTKFRNKDVLHPNALRDSDVVVIPYGQSGHRIRKRFSEQYQGQFIVV